MDLGVFSVSLAVKDINSSKAFYEKIGFEVFAGDIEQKYLIMKNKSSIIGLFEGMFENNILTFNPGWDENAATLDQYDDIRTIQQHLKENNIKLESEIEPNTTGPANFSVIDPDGNVILIDQHV